jgi:hypothetical protein
MRFRSPEKLGERVGFFGGGDTDIARTHAWCQHCEQTLRALNGASLEQRFEHANFKIFCKCWDEITFRQTPSSLEL